MSRKKSWPDETIMISVKVPKSLYEEARKKSDETGVSISFVVRKALAEWILDCPMIIDTSRNAPSTEMGVGIELRLKDKSNWFSDMTEGE